MAKNWAVVIGINGYTPTNFQPLRYAKRDAELVRDFFNQEAKFDEVCFFTDDSSPLEIHDGITIPTYPSRGHLMSFLYDRFEQPFLEAGDNCWFFFAGHGQQVDNRDYLMPIDANPRMSGSGIEVNYVRERLMRCGADNVILLLDACRNEGRSGAIGIGEEPQKGVITISSCRPTQKSYEIEKLEQGAFTYALLEALRLPGERNCATVERLDQYLRTRVPQLCKEYDKAPIQNPATAIDPSSKKHFILLPDFATDSDIENLKNQIFRASHNKNLKFAEQLCIRAIAAARGNDLELLNLLVELRQRQNTTNNAAPTTPKPIQPVTYSRGETTTSIPPKPPATYSRRKTTASPVPPEPVTAATDSRTTKTISANIDSIPLESEKGVDYSKLRDLLKSKKWEEADQETLQVMLQVSNRTSQGWLDSDALKQFPCKDLRTIDRLWAEASNSHFGFSVQKKIWEKCGSPRHGKQWDDFCNKIGWKEGSSYVSYSALRCDLNNSPKGELPFWGCWMFWWSGSWSWGWGCEGVSFLAQRLANCSTQQS